MATRTLKAVSVAVAASAVLGLAVPAGAASIGTGSLVLAPAHAEAQKVGYWYRGRWYGGGCWNCRGVNGAAVGAGVALGVLGAAAIAGAAAAPPPPPPVVYVEPAPRVYIEPAPGPRRCWVETDSRGYGYWSAC